METQFAYLSRGKLYVKLADKPIRPVESRFGESMRDRAIQIQDRNAWKSEGSGAKFMSGGRLSGRTLWGGSGADPLEMRIVISSAAAGCRDDEMLYSLDTPDIGGVFLLRNGATEESRLFHTADHRFRRLAASYANDRIACVVQYKRGGACIAIMNGDCTGLQDVTQGDCDDDAPRWVEGSSRELVFQSAAIGRNEDGAAVARGPFAIHKLDVEAGEMTTLCEDSKSDFIAPYAASDGTLYYIRRPYEDPNKRLSLPRVLLDLVLLPFRLLYAIFQYLNFFTARYTGNTLITSGGARQQQADLNEMTIYGNLVNAQNAAKQAGKGEAPDLVPKSWELIRQSPGGTNTTLARGVIAFDICTDGAILYSNGSAIFRIDAQGVTERLVKDAFIRQVVAIR